MVALIIKYIDHVGEAKPVSTTVVEIPYKSKSGSPANLTVRSMDALQTSLIISKRDKYEKIIFQTTIPKTKTAQTSTTYAKVFTHKDQWKFKAIIQICIQELKNNYPNNNNFN